VRLNSDFLCFDVTPVPCTVLEQRVSFSSFPELRLKKSTQLDSDAQTKPPDAVTCPKLTIEKCKKAHSRFWLASATTQDVITNRTVVFVLSP